MTKQALRDKIKDLEFQLECVITRRTLKIQEERLNAERDKLKLEEAFAEQKAITTQLEKRINEHPYKQLTDLLKAIAVKLPELNIKELAIHTKCKK